MNLFTDFSNFLKFIYFERDSMHGWGAERDEDGESQAGSMLWEQNWMRGSNLWNRDHDLSWNLELDA